VRQVGRKLGVRYVLEGGGRKSGARLRVTAQLVEAETGAHLCANKFDGELKDVFEFQDQITDSLVGIVEPSVRKSEIGRSCRKRRESLDAHDFYLRALPYVGPISPTNAPIATEYLLKALNLDPNYAAAHAYLAWAHQGWARTPKPRSTPLGALCLATRRPRSPITSVARFTRAAAATQSGGLPMLIARCA
jgi:hypothetical protein